MSDRKQQQNQNQNQSQGGDPRAASQGGQTPGAAGHPEPGSQPDDSQLETVADGPAAPIVDGQPGAFGVGETVGGADSQTNEEGKAAAVGA
jgi:hypothetical protein